MKVIARYGVGVGNVDLDAATDKSIVVTNTPHANSVSVAELTLGLMIAAARSIPQNPAEVCAGRWPQERGLTFQGRTVGILGFGSIGKGVARRLAGWNCKVLAYHPYPDRELADKLCVEITSFDEVLAQADFVSLHLPEYPETRQMANSLFLRKMKQGAVLINAAGGELVD